MASKRATRGAARAGRVARNDGDQLAARRHGCDARVGRMGVYSGLSPADRERAARDGEIRRVFKKSAGTQLNEQASVKARARRPRRPPWSSPRRRGRARSAYPTPANLVVGGGFSHQEMRSVQESYTQQVPYTATESYSCSSGRSYSTCTRTVTRYRSEMRYRTVLRNVEVSDGRCAASVALVPRNGHIYVLDYTYRDDGVCSVACLEQVAILGTDRSRARPVPRRTPKSCARSPAPTSSAPRRSQQEPLASGRVAHERLHAEPADVRGTGAAAGRSPRRTGLLISSVSCSGYAVATGRSRTISATSLPRRPAPPSSSRRACRRGTAAPSPRAPGT